MHCCAEWTTLPQSAAAAAASRFHSQAPALSAVSHFDEHLLPSPHSGSSNRRAGTGPDSEGGAGDEDFMEAVDHRVTARVAEARAMTPADVEAEQKRLDDRLELREERKQEVAGAAATPTAAADATADAAVGSGTSGGGSSRGKARRVTFAGAGGGGGSSEALDSDDDDHTDAKGKPKKGGARSEAQQLEATAQALRNAVSLPQGAPGRAKAGEFRPDSQHNVLVESFMSRW